MFNRILGRSMDPTLVDDADVSPFQDVPADGWYYRDVMEATVSHTNDAVEGDECWKVTFTRTGLPSGTAQPERPAGAGGEDP